MANPLTPQLAIGTTGELLAQLHLLQYDVQAAPPLKDTGNDLIAIKGLNLKCVQVKTSIRGTFSLKNLRETQRRYDFVLFVKLKCDGKKILLDQSKIFLLTKKEIFENIKNKHSISATKLTKYSLDESIINKIFKPETDKLNNGKII